MHSLRAGFAYIKKYPKRKFVQLQGVSHQNCALSYVSIWGVLVPWAESACVQYITDHYLSSRDIYWPGHLWYSSRIKQRNVNLFFSLVQRNFSGKSWMLQWRQRLFGQITLCVVNWHFSNVVYGAVSPSLKLQLKAYWDFQMRYFMFLYLNGMQSYKSPKIDWFCFLYKMEILWTSKFDDL